MNEQAVVAQPESTNRTVIADNANTVIPVAENANPTEAIEEHADSVNPIAGNANPTNAIEEHADSVNPIAENANPTDMAAKAAVQKSSIDSFEPLTAEQEKILSSMVWDVDPEVLNAVEQKNEGGHFPFSDEKHLDLFREHIENLGGTYIGVGTDQGYLFAGWQRPTLALMIDYDPWVVIIHRIYMTFWKECADSACLYNYFNDRDLGMAFLKSDKGIAAGLHEKLPLKVFKTTHRSIARQLRRLEKMDAKTFMNDADTFQYIKKMIELGRFRTMQANLLGDRAFASIADALNQTGAKVTTFYVSNAEQYWGYSAQFKKNIVALPAADDGLILRTSATYPNNNDYRYSIQPIHVFKAWLQHPDGKNVRDVTKRVRVKDPEDFPFVVDDFMPPKTGE